MDVREFYDVWGGEGLLQRLALPEGPVCLFAAVSGGADSVLLLHALAALQREHAGRGISLLICHVSHGIRGSEGDRDAVFVKDLADRYGLPFLFKAVDAPSLASEQKRGLEAAARSLRYQAFHEMMAAEGFRPINGEPSADSLHTEEWMDEEGCRGFLILAHHGGDQAESILLNIQRGSGLNGLTGMSRAAGALRRPWLDLPSHLIPSVIAAEQLPFISDSTNDARIYTRNRVRLDLLPLWDRIAGHSIEQKLIELSSRLVRDEALLQRAAEAELQKAECGLWVIRDTDGHLTLSMYASDSLPSPDTSQSPSLIIVPVWSAARVAGADEALAGRMLASAADRCGSSYDLEARHYALMYRWLSSDRSGTLDLPAGQRFYRNGDAFIFIPSELKRLLDAITLLEVHGPARDSTIGADSDKPVLRLLTFGKINEEPAAYVVGQPDLSYNEVYVRKPNRIDIGTLYNYRTRREGDTIPASVFQCQNNNNDKPSSSAKRVGLKRLWQRFRIPEFLRDRVIFKVNDNDEIIRPARIEDIEQTVKNE